MKNHLLFIGLISILFGSTSCNNSKKNQLPTQNNKISNTSGKDFEKNRSIKEQRKKPSEFLPEGYVIFEEIYGDLNKDGLEDCIIIIKGTDKSKIIKDEYRGELDRNRRGIIVLFNKKGYYELAAKNYDCFSSENEDGGVYFAPELSADVKKGNLYIHYGHGRYGYWRYTFRFNNPDFELIGYDESSNTGPRVDKETSINFLTKKKLEKVNINENNESDDEIFEETRKSINIKELIKLSEIKDFDELDMSY